MVEIYTLYDSAAEQFGPLTFHKSFADAKRSLCQQIDKNADLKNLLCMDFSLVRLGTYDQEDVLHPLYSEQPEYHSVKDIWKEYCSQLLDLNIELGEVKDNDHA